MSSNAAVSTRTIVITFAVVEAVLICVFIAWRLHQP